MSRQATQINLTDEERRTLEQWLRSSTTEQRLVVRARIILSAAKGDDTKRIAEQLRLRPATVSKWRIRFGRHGLSGLQDAPRPGARRLYDASTEKRILALLDQDPPTGYATWSGRLLAKELGDVSKHQIWRVLRRHGIHLQRRRSWCISTDPEFGAKAADIVGLYLDPPENAVVICVDEKPHIQALERAQGWLRLPNGKSLTGFNHGYKRHGTTTLFAALNVATGQVKAGHYKRRRRREFLDFMNEVVADYPEREIHVILDNLNTHKPKHDGWLARHPCVHFHYTPTHASWLNQVEVWFSILSRLALKPASFTSPRQVRNAIDLFLAAHNKDAAAFEWRKRQVHPKRFKKYYSDLCN
jgi:transposase